MNSEEKIRTRAAGRPQPFGLYDPGQDRDSCGVGFVARLDAQPEHQVVRDAVQVLVNLEHRGAVGGDKLTGDGAGLLLQIPDAFFRRILGATGRSPLPQAGQYAVGMVFLPTDAALAARCAGALESAARGEGAEVLSWRDVPTSNSHLGDLARESQPVIRQVFLGRGRIAADAFERKLYVIRRRAEKEVASWSGADAGPFYVASLSSRTVVYKGMLRGSQLVEFYPDLGEADFASAFAVVHQRYSTNTFPTWSLAQPLRLLGHNGEINTLRGNVSHMRAREADLASAALGGDLEKLLPAIVAGGSDSAQFDNVLELLVMAGRSLPHAAMMMVPEAWGLKFHMSDDKRAFYEYHAAIMEPWDGPAALVFTDGRYIGATLDRNGLRPCRYTVTRDGYVVLASETGVLEFAPERILRRGRLQPGKMLLVDLEQHRIVPDNEVKAKVSRQRPYRRWVRDNRIELRGLRCIRIQWSGPDASGLATASPPGTATGRAVAGWQAGRQTFKEAPGTGFELKADLVLLALGFLHVEHGPIVEQLGLATDDRGNLAVDANFQTNVPGVFAAGDSVAGASLVVRAIAQGRQMAAAVDAFLRRLPQT